jgi:hypothetical protein
VDLDGERARRKALRRAKNILAAKRSNARRKEANVELERAFALTRRMEAKLLEREAELLAENSDLRAQLGLSSRETAGGA